jgi:hypothetical protein
MRNFNNFDLVLCGFMLGSISWVEMGSVFFLVSVFVIDCFADYYLMGCFHIARHLAAKTGTNFAVFDLIGPLC